MAHPVPAETYEQLYHRAPCGYATVDLGGRIRRANLTFASMVGRDLEDLQHGMPIDDLVSDGSGRPLSAAFDHHAERTIEAVLTTADGGRVPVRLDIAPRATDALAPTFMRMTIQRLPVTAGKDILDAAPPAAFPEPEDRWRAVLENTNQGVWDHDVENGRTYYSTAWKSMLGYGEEDVGFDPDLWMDLIHPDDRSEVIEANSDHLAGLTDVFDKEFRIRHRDGRYIWVHDRGKVTRRAPDGRPLRMIGVHTEITARKRLEQELRDARDRAEQSARARTDFLANMSHELRTPLTGIIGAAELLLGDLRESLSPAHRQTVEMQAEAGRALLAVVNDVLDFSKIDAGRLTTERVLFDLPKLVNSAVELVAGQARLRGIALSFEVAASVRASALGDPGRLRQILLNLLSNGVKFTPHGGNVKLVVRERADGSTVFSVHDDGIGIPPDKLRRLFVRYGQADASTSRLFGGTGLGLVISQSLVELMNGTIEVRSRPGMGSTFTVVLDLRAPAGAKPASPPKPAKPPALRRRVLLAEDNRLNQQFISLMLKNAECEVTVVGDGVSAVEALLGPGATEFDVVLMDVQMPIMDGLQATRLIRRGLNGKPLPIIALTANTFAEEIERCLAEGMDAHVAKPVDWPELFSTIDRLADLRSDQSAGTTQVTHSFQRPGPDSSRTVFDPTRLAELGNALGDGGIGGLMSLFRRELDERLTAMEAHSGDTDRVVAEAHALASSSGTMGCVELFEICTGLLETARDGAMDMKPHVLVLRAAATRARAALEEHAPS